VGQPEQDCENRTGTRGHAECVAKNGRVENDSSRPERLQGQGSQNRTIRTVLADIGTANFSALAKHLKKWTTT
jgi:hypothetical protein